jgi:O-antigen ligase
MTIVVMAWQVNLPMNLPQFDIASLPLPYLAPSVSLAEVTAVIAIIFYALAGWPNSTVLRSGLRRLFALTLIGLALFETFSISWAPQRDLAAMQVVHVSIWIAFALLIVCSDWSASTMAFALLVGLLIHSSVGIIQISVRPVVSIIPQNSGISVVFNGAEHWQRVYGLSPHPNLLGGHLAVGVILTFGLMMIYRGRRRFWLIAAWLFCWIILLLTFSRSAWLAVIAGGLTALILLQRGRQLNQTVRNLLLVLVGVGLFVVVAFALWFQPFLANRFNFTASVYETQAIAERVSAARLALQIFVAHPLIGVGISQSVVVTRDLVGTPIDWIHNVPLLAASELGMVGITLVAFLMIALVAVGVQRWRTRSISMWQALVGSGLIALIVVMQFDHYVWTMPQGGLLWAWLAGWWMRANHITAS